MNTLKEQDGRYYQECGVVMIATENNSPLYLSKHNILYKDYININPLKYIHEGYKPQHLYITSNEEIKEGNYYLNTSSKRIVKATKYDENYFKSSPHNCKKIIATTDESLELPKPSDSFIQKYIEEYNRGNIITNLLVEYEKQGTYTLLNKMDKECSPEIFKPDGTYKLKVDSNNIITIKKIKNYYNRKEVEELISDAFDLGHDWGAASIGGMREELQTFYEFIKQKL